MNEHYVDDPHDLHRAVQSWRECRVIGLDTEFIRTRTFYPIPALYQVATPDATYLVDPLPIDQWDDFADLLRDPNATIVMHACSEDLEVFARHLQIQPAGLFDTQVAEGFLGPDFSLSYAALVERYGGTTLAKQATRSDWLARPLSEGQLHYAREDVEHLLMLHESLVAGLRETGRLEWFEEENQRRTRANGVAPDQYYRSLKKAWRFSPRQLGRLQGICSWREQRARTRDLPRQRVVRDEHLLDLAVEPRSDKEAVFGALPEPIAKRFSRDLARVLEAADALPETDLPPPLERPLNQRESELVKRLRAIARERAEQLGFAAELLSRRRDVEACLRYFIEHRQLHEVFRSWRYPLVGARFEELLETEVGSR